MSYLNFSDIPLTRIDDVTSVVGSEGLNDNSDVTIYFLNRSNKVMAGLVMEKRVACLLRSLLGNCETTPR